jgi:hypothetical protein
MLFFNTNGFIAACSARSFNLWLQSADNACRALLDPANRLKRCDQTDPESWIREFRMAGSMRGKMATRH